MVRTTSPFILPVNAFDVPREDLISILRKSKELVFNVLLNKSISKQPLCQKKLGKNVNFINLVIGFQR